MSEVTPYLKDFTFFLQKGRSIYYLRGSEYATLWMKVWHRLARFIRMQTSIQSICQISPEIIAVSAIVEIFGDLNLKISRVHYSYYDIFFFRYNSTQKKWNLCSVYDPFSLDNLIKCLDLHVPLKESFIVTQTMNKILQTFPLFSEIQIDDFPCLSWK